MRLRGVGRMVLAVAVALGMIAPAVAQQTLNPVVTVLPKPSTPVPDDCEKGLTESPAAPRVTPEEKKAAIPAPPPPPPAPPPAPTLRGAFAELENAAERGDRDAFRTALARARETVANYPAGGEKNAATRALEVYEDIGALIDYQNDARIGAFFDASSGDLLARMKKYPDYQRSISDLTIVDATGTRFYPTRETREFLIREAASRLRGVPPSTAVKAPAPPTTAPSTKPPKPAPKVTEKPRAPHKAPAVKKPAHVTPAPKTAHAAPKKKPAPVPSTKHATAPKPVVKKPVAKPVTKVAEAKPPVKVTEKPAPMPVAKPAPKPAPAPVTPTPPTTTTATAPVPTQTATTAPATTTTPPTTTPTTPPTSTTTWHSATTTTPSTTSAAPEKPEKPAESHRSLLLPIILIVLGIAVLIMLFRSSS